MTLTSLSNEEAELLVNYLTDLSLMISWMRHQAAGPSSAQYECNDNCQKQNDSGND
jgi:hypothetical protein